MGDNPEDGKLKIKRVDNDARIGRMHGWQYEPLITVHQATDEKIRSAVAWLDAGGGPPATPQPATDTPEAGAEENPFLSKGEQNAMVMHIAGLDAENTRLRAEVARVTAERETWFDLWLDCANDHGDPMRALAESRADLAAETSRRARWETAANRRLDSRLNAQSALDAERETRERTREAHAILLRATSDALADEERYADALRLALFTSADHAHLHERHHKGELLDCELPYCSGEIKAIRAHDARRKREGGE